MLKKTLSIFFTVLFVATIIVPSVLIIVDDSVDISVFFDLSEEEEEKGKEKDKLESFLAINNSESRSFLLEEKKKSVGYYFKNYPKPHLNLISPPPEHIIL